MTGSDLTTSRRSELFTLLADLASAANEDLPDAALFQQLCEALCGMGVPLWRAAMQLENLHP